MTWCVVFDMDDTLYLERDYVRSGFAAVGHHVETVHEVSGFGDMAWNLFETGVRGDTFDRVLAELDLHARVEVGELVEVYRSHRPKIDLLAAADRALDRAAELGPVAVITDGPEVAQRNKAEALGLQQRTDLVVFTGALGPGKSKPHPAAFELVAAHSGLDVGHHVYIGDNPGKDFVAPHALGWRTVRVRCPGQLHASAPSGDDVDEELSCLDELRLSEVPR